MHRRRITMVPVGVIVPLLFLFSAIPTHAHGRHGHGRFTILKGTIIGLKSGSLQMQTQTSTVTIPLTGATHVVRQVSGSMADVKTKASVTVHIVKGTTRVDSIRVDQTSKVPHLPGPGNHHPGPDHDRDGGTKSQNEGKVTSVSDSAITLRDPRGRSTTYSLANTVTVTKSLDGSQNDLAIGETVQVTRGQSGNAMLVVILNA